VAATLSDIKRRINTTAQIRKVTGTLQKVASAKLVQDLRRIANAQVYFQSLCRMLQLAHDARPAGAIAHPLMTTHPGDTISLVVFGSDRGLCGAFNTLLMKAVREFVNAHPDKTVQLLLRGRVVYRRALRQKMTPIEQVEDAASIADRALSGFLDHLTSEVHILHWHYLNGVNQRIVAEQLLPTPFSAKAATRAAAEAYDGGLIEPGPEALIEALLPEYIRCSVHNAFYSSAVTEHAQRRASMSRATKNASEMLVTLKKTYSRLRQENITTEMLEIVSGMSRE